MQHPVRQATDCVIVNTNVLQGTGESALLLGATGATGKYVLREALASSHFTRVIEAGRRVTSPEDLADAPGKDKLVQKVIDFEKLEAADLKSLDADVVIITVSGTSVIAMSNLAFHPHLL